MQQFSSIYTDVEGHFMGFQPSLNTDTYLLLTASCVIPIQFVNDKIQKHPNRPVIHRNDSYTMWAVREIAKDTIAVGFFDRQDIEIYVYDQLTRTISVGMRIFGFIIPPISALDSSN